MTVDNEDVSMRRVEEELMREKGFVSEDTDANSRLTVFTNKAKMIGGNDELRSLSPKVEGRRKVVKLSSTSNSNANMKSSIPNR